MANKYLRAGASGSANGDDWTNAYTTLAALETGLARGDTGYVADGAYAGATFNTATSGTTLITIKKATVADHGTETGWDNAYGDGQATFSASLTFASAYWWFDGVTGGGPGSWTSGFGFKRTVAGSGAGVDFDAANITCKHIEVAGNGGDGDGSGTSNDSFAWGTNGDSTLLSYFYAHDAGRCHFFSNADSTDVIVEYGYTGLFESTAGEHSEVASIWGGSYRWTFRYCVITHIEGTGGIIYDAQGGSVGQRWMRIYGNVFIKIAGNPAWSAANGVVAGWTGAGGEQYRDVVCVNNTFIDTESGGEALGTLPTTSSGNVAKNNLFYSVGDVGGGSVWGTITHNHFISTTTAGTSTSTGSGDPFTNLAGLDFTLTANTTAGEDLGAPYNVDMLGRTRSTWTRGALEFEAEPPPSDELNITNLNATTMTVG